MGNGKGGEFADELVKFVSLFEMIAKEVNLVSGDAGTFVGTVFPALVFEVGAVADDALTIGSRPFTVFFLERATLDGSEGRETCEDFVGAGLGRRNVGHAKIMSSILDIFKSK